MKFEEDINTQLDIYLQQLEDAHAQQEKLARGTIYSPINEEQEYQDLSPGGSRLVAFQKNAHHESQQTLSIIPSVNN